MPRFAANLTMMFNEWAFLDRFGAAADAGFEAVEFLFPYDHAPDDIARRLADRGLTLALFNAPPGDFAAGERGLASRSDRVEDHRRSIDLALAYAGATGVERIHVMSGHGDPTDPDTCRTWRDALALAADRCGEHGIDVVLEPLNSRDFPGYFLNDFGLAVDLILAVGRPNLKLQFDIYHRQIMHGDVTAGLRELMPIVGHVQIASVPSRHEPDSEELAAPFLFAELDRLGYAGFVGAEYRPRAGTLAGLSWFAPYRHRA